MRYFDHDTTASSDDLILALRIAHGGAAVDCFWAILEQIYREEKPTAIARNRPETQSLCARLCLGYEVVHEYVTTMVSYGLLTADETDDGGYENVVSERAMENIEAYQKMCEKNRRNGQKGGRKPNRKSNGNRVETQSVATGGDKKRKEKKVMGSYKKNPITSASDVADADEAAPSSAPLCPLCSKPLHMRIVGGEMRYTCDLCGDVKEPMLGKAVIA